ncbi:4Fe-4S single cluster domain-containing protein [Streptomyces yaizuensis]|uniref:Radical SAM protein n=1 Tax=Streptomyces yaizuensis TaxID=2989713 RepID=A0ABQ5P248_9ACTN|nr:4Fe-4S single cluster domain-containing protein [Streptomyces sp. YSPA8]GLF96577.1 hypothetical protein SYYSPA8_19790 [Streptomyces sp. YSPA8]
MGDDGTAGGRPELRVSGTHFPVRTLGPGSRLGVWLQGCALACPGCMSRHTWDPRGGSPRTVDSLLELWRSALEAGADGLTVSGGEPLDQPDGLAALLAGAARLRDAAGGGPVADLLLYTGYEDGEIAGEPARTAAVRSADALITGRYRAGEPTALVWRGSANQRLRPLTALGRARYAEHLGRTDPTGSRLQVETAEGEDDVRLYGVPRRGELAALERRLRGVGIRVLAAGWRPEGRRGPGADDGDGGGPVGGYESGRGHEAGGRHGDGDGRGPVGRYESGRGHEAGGRHGDGDGRGQEPEGRHEPKGPYEPGDGYEPEGRHKAGGQYKAERGPGGRPEAGGRHEPRGRYEPGYGS